MLKFARRRSSSTDRESMRKTCRSGTGGGGGDLVLITPKQRSSSAERSSSMQQAVPVSNNIHLESPATPTKVEARTASTASVRRIDNPHHQPTTVDKFYPSPATIHRNSLTTATTLPLSKPIFAPMTSTVSQLTSVMADIHVGDRHSDVGLKAAGNDGSSTRSPAAENGHTAATTMLPPPPVLPRKPKVDNFLHHAAVSHPHSAQLWKIELLDTSGESGYGTDSSDNNSLRSQESSTREPSPPPLPKRKPRRRVQFDSYVLLIQSLKDRDLRGILSTIFNVSAEALCTEDVIYHFHTAILRQDYEVTDLLVRAGCDVNTFDHRGWSALHCACSVARLDIIKLLLQNGAAVLARTHHTSQTGSQLLPPDNPAFNQCLAYLRCMEECLGTVNSHLVMAAANYRAGRIDELGITKGDRLVVLRRGDVNNEMWWWVRNSRSEEGYVLRDLLALNSRHS